MVPPLPPPDCRTVFAAQAEDARERFILNSAFDDAARISGTAAMVIALHDLPPVKWFKLDASAHAQPVFTLEYEGCNFRDNYRIEPDRGAITGGILECSLRDRTTGRRMFANRVVLGHALGLQRMTFDAASMAGGYVWARAGALPVHDDDGDACDYLSSQLFTRAALLDNVLDRAEKDRMLHLCELAEPQAKWALADWSRPIDVAPDRFDMALRAHMAGSFFNHGTYASDGFLNGGMTLNRFMLLGTCYVAELHFNNAAQMDRLADYTGMDLPQKNTPRRMFVP